jgi:uncharacterized protein YjaG (DUF416 family)
MNVRPWLLPALLLLPACSINSRLNKLEDAAAEAVDLACSCTNVFPDRDACEAMFGSFLSAFDRDCLEDALKADKDGSKASLDCLIEVQEDYNDCLRANLDCNDSQSIAGCEDVYQRECPDLPEAVQVEVAMCGAGND